MSRRLKARREFFDENEGERQIISIARAFLKDAPIILLDEATAELEEKQGIYKHMAEIQKQSATYYFIQRIKSRISIDKSS